MTGSPPFGPPPGYGPGAGPPPPWPTTPERSGWWRRLRTAWQGFPSPLRTSFIIAAVLLVAGGTVLGVLSARSSGPLRLVPGLGGSSPDGYLYRDANTVVFVQWTQTGSDLSGTLDVAYIDPNDATQVTTETHSITGVLANGSVTLTLDKSVLGTTNLSGTFNGSALTLNVPEADGTITQATFSPASLSDYNGDVSTLQNQAGRARSAQQQAEQQQAEQQALAQAEKKVDDAVATVESDLSGLSHDTDFSSGLGEVSSSVAQTDKDLASTQQAAKSTEAEAQQYPGGNYGQVCADAGGVNADAGGVDADAGGVEASAGGVEAALQAARNDVTTLQSDFAAIASAESQVPQYRPSNAPTSDQVDAAVAAAQKAMSQAVSTANAAIDHANGDVTAAYSAADQASQAGNCGPGPSAPEPQGHIS